MSKPEAFSRRRVISVAGATGMAYIIIACLWIASSDTLLVWIFPELDIRTMAFLQTLKGWGFVGVTGLLFTVILYRQLSEIGSSQRSLQEHMESYRMLFQYNPQPMWVYNPDSLRFIEVNEAAIRTYGYSRDEFLAMTLADIRASEATDSSPLPSTLSGLRAEGIQQHLWKNGSLRHVQLSSGDIHFLGQNLRLGLVHDITEQYRAEEKLRKSERKFRNVLDNSIDVIYELEPETGRYNYVSPSASRVLSLTAEELMRGGSELLIDCIHDDDRSLVRQHIGELMHGSGDEHAMPSVEYRVRTPDGTERWVRETSSVVGDRAGTGRVIAGTIRDVTARKQYEGAIRQLNEELERRVYERTLQLEATNSELEAFSYSVSHDLRAPLRSIGGFSRILIEDYSSRLDARGLDYLQRIGAAGRRMGQLINALLNLSQVTRTGMNPVQIDISSMATAIIEDLRSAQPQRVVQFRAGPHLAVQADPGMMRIVLENLLGNAWKFTGGREEALIELFSLIKSDQTVYCVRDNGVGFDMDYAGKLFTPFQRLHSSREFEGTGIGLATVQRIISRHGGQIWAESIVDRGATFCFTISV